jgi:hypothetical protein
MLAWVQESAALAALAALSKDDVLRLLTRVAVWILVLVQPRARVCSWARRRWHVRRRNCHHGRQGQYAAPAAASRHPRQHVQLAFTQLSLAGARSQVGKATELARAQGVIAITAGKGDVLRLVPPLVISNAEIDEGAAILGRCLNELTGYKA